MFAGPLGRSTFTPPKSSFDSPLYGLVSLRRSQIDPTRCQKTWRTAWRSLTKAADLKGFRFHDLRHTAITELAEAGAPDATLMAITGHMTQRMLEHYSHVRMEAKRAAVDKLSSGVMGKPPAGTGDLTGKVS